MFEKEPVPEELEEEMRAKRRKMMDPPEDWGPSHGTNALTEVWELGYTGLENLTFQRPYVS